MLPHIYSIIFISQYCTQLFFCLVFSYVHHLFYTSVCFTSYNLQVHTSHPMYCVFNICFACTISYHAVIFLFLSNITYMSKFVAHCFTYVCTFFLSFVKFLTIQFCFKTYQNLSHNVMCFITCEYFGCTFFFNNAVIYDIHVQICHTMS